VLALFSLTIFLAAALLFLVQPLAGKILLPALGGSPAVWNTCMVFFQGVLLLGYAYSHVLTRKLRPRMQAIVHAAVIAIAVVTLPIAIHVGEPSGSPVVWLLTTLTTIVALPFFVVSTTGPLLQRWFSYSSHASAEDPYFLYVASNAGSAVGLLAYPFVLEPLLTRREQSLAWTVGYALFAMLVVACAAALWRAFSRAEFHAGAPDPPGVNPERASPPIAWRRRLLWIAYALVPSSLMLGVTQHVTTDIAAVPLLWILPLLLYLVTLILAFSKRRLLSASVLGRATPIAIATISMVLLSAAKTPFYAIVPIHLVVYFLVALLAHTRLADDRPPTDRLTEYYLCMSIGGVLGGAVNALLAPLLLDAVTEYPLLLGLACLLRPQLASDEKDAAPGSRWSRVILAVAIGSLLAVVTLVIDAKINSGAVGDLVTKVRQSKGMEAILDALRLDNDAIAVALRAGLPTLVCIVLLLRKGSMRYAIAVTAVLCVVPYLNRSGSVVVQDRTFFGVHRVSRDAQDRWHVLVHGTTLHGQQLRTDEKRTTPSTYYHPSGPVGDAMKVLAESRSLDRAAFVGLGAGSMAAYAKPSMHFTFYEIDAGIERLASDERVFSFVPDAKARGARVDIRIADGRIGLQGDADGTYRVLVLDAFTSDAIPVHLLTREAVEMYMRKLKPDGLLVVHISNRYFKLQPVLAKIAESLSLVGYVRDDNVVTKEQSAEGKAESTWVILAREPRHLRGLEHLPTWERLIAKPSDPLWTDDFSNILRVMNWK
jgi:spermidine synthase